MKKFLKAILGLFSKIREPGIFSKISASSVFSTSDSLKPYQKARKRNEPISRKSVDRQTEWKDFVSRGFKEKISCPYVYF